MKSSITAIILTLNEEIHIRRCLKLILPLVERVVVVDSFSTDSTVEIAREMGAEVLQRPFSNQADQFQWALDTIDVQSEWVLRLDADEYLEGPLIEEIARRLPSLPATVTGVRLKRKLIFRGKWIRFGGYYPAVLLRLWRRGTAEMQPLWMDEHAVLKRGSSIVLKHDFCDHNLRSITWWIEKHNRYATRKMADFIALEHGLREADAALSAGVADGSRAWKRFLQYSAFRRSPLYVRCVLHFLYRYVLRLGFLDGKEGFIWHVLQGFWYFVLTDVKIEDARMLIAEHGIAAFKERLAAEHGIKL